MNLQNVEFVRSAASAGDFFHDALPQIAFAGKSNVGKSSVINCLLRRKNFARVGEAPGKTIHVNYFRVDDKAYFVDLPGYGYAKVSQAEKARWSRLMESYFADVNIALGILIVDAGRRLLLRMPKKPLPLLLFFLSLAAILAGSFFSVRLSSVILMLSAGAVSVLAYAVSGKGGQRP